MPSPAVPLSGENEATVGAPGATVSTVTVSAAEAVLRLPARIHRLGGEGVAAVGQRGGRKRPGTAAIGDRSADLGGTVEHLDRAAGHRRPASA